MQIYREVQDAEMHLFSLTHSFPKIVTHTYAYSCVFDSQLTPDVSFEYSNGWSNRHRQLNDVHVHVPSSPHTPPIITPLTLSHTHRLITNYTV